jgi:pyruvate dehydrogenase (quinone)
LGRPAHGVGGARHENLTQVTCEQRVMEDAPEFIGASGDRLRELPRLADLIGLDAIKVTQSSEIEDAWRAALSADRPVIISALTDPNEAPRPPLITFQQGEGFAKWIEKDPTSGMAGAIESLREKAQEFLPEQ